MVILSSQARSLWAKKSRESGNQWLPLCMHMHDAAIVAEKIWDSWVAPGVKQAIAAGLGRFDAERLVIFLAAVHDIGKAMPVFQFSKSFPLNTTLDALIQDAILFTGLPGCEPHEFTNRRYTTHALAGQLLLEAAGCNRSVASIIGSHHGKPQSYNALTRRGISTYDFNYHLGAEGREGWQAIQRELIGYALSLAGIHALSELPRPSLQAQVLLTGIVIMVDWIVSNEGDFPYITLGLASEPDDLVERALDGWQRLSLTDPWIPRVEVDDIADLFRDRFGFAEPNELQGAAVEIAQGLREPGIMVIEAPMGKGKTEAALAVAEYLAEISRRNGVYFALPTQATSNAIFPRITQWIDNLETNVGQSISLAHGKAQFNDDFTSLKGASGQVNVEADEDTTLLVHQWFTGRKRSMLTDFVVGTIDQLLLAALKQKHLMLRHLGLAQKIVIIDECHAYDAYMSQYLERALQWLGAYQVPVIVLSATLPAAQRKAVINAYLNINDAVPMETDLFGNLIEIPASAPWTENRKYPLITYTEGSEVLQRAPVPMDDAKSVEVSSLSQEDIVHCLREQLVDGGCAGVIVNTVKKAQEVARVLRTHFGEETVHLLHAQFLAPDRAIKEQRLLQALGKPGSTTLRPPLRIDVGTQVLEQSLDIDFDVLIMELAPMDLLLQRMGRLHRHERERPKRLRTARCYLIGDEDEVKASEIIYGRYLLQRTRELVPKFIHLPQDIPDLVHKAYERISEEEAATDGFDTDPELKAYREKLALKRQKAHKYRLGPAWTGTGNHLVGWLDADLSDQHGEAAVRDTDDTVEVLLVQDQGEGAYRLISQEAPTILISGHDVPDLATGRLIARERINLPRVLCYPWAIKQTIDELEALNLQYLSEWQKCDWVKGELVLILDKTDSAKLNGWVLTYSVQSGLSYKKEEGEDGGKGIRLAP